MRASTSNVSESAPSLQPTTTGAPSPRSSIALMSASADEAEQVSAVAQLQPVRDASQRGVHTAPARAERERGARHASFARDDVEKLALAWRAERETRRRARGTRGQRADRTVLEPGEVHPPVD